jgi:hypothetical protein
VESSQSFSRSRYWIDWARNSLVATDNVNKKATRRALFRFMARDNSKDLRTVHAIHARRLSSVALSLDVVPRGIEGPMATACE